MPNSGMNMASEVCVLSWKEHYRILLSFFENLLENKVLVDCTLAAEGHYIKAHKVVLSAFSSYLKILFSEESDKHPIVILKDVKFHDLKAVVDFMYKGEIHINEDRLGSFLEIAKTLQIKSLGSRREIILGDTVGMTPSSRGSEVLVSRSLSRDPLANSEISVEQCTAVLLENIQDSENRFCAQSPLQGVSESETSGGMLPHASSFILTSSSGQHLSENGQRSLSHSPCGLIVPSILPDGNLSANTRSAMETSEFNELDSCPPNEHEVDRFLDAPGEWNKVKAHVDFKQSVHKEATIDTEQRNLGYHSCESLSVLSLLPGQNLNPGAWNSELCESDDCSLNECEDDNGVDKSLDDPVCGNEVEEVDTGGNPICEEVTNDFEQRSLELHPHGSARVRPFLAGKNLTTDTRNAPKSTLGGLGSDFVNKLSCEEDIQMGKSSDNREKGTEVEGELDIVDHPILGGAGECNESCNLGEQLKVQALLGDAAALRGACAAGSPPDACRNSPKTARCMGPQLRGRARQCSLSENRTPTKQCSVRLTPLHMAKKTNQCSVCAKKFSQKGDLLVHMCLHTGERPFVCSVCGKRFSQKGNLKIHARLHYGEKQFVCSACGKKFAQQRKLNIHMRSHLEEKLNVCSVPAEKFFQRGRFEVQMSSHVTCNMYPCSVCEKTFTEKRVYNAHMRTHKEYPNSCSVCSRRFTHKAHLANHMRSHTGKKIVCGKRFSKTRNLSTHRSFHSGEKPFVCSVCGMNFAQKTSHRIHMQSHPEAKLNVCHLCAKKFNDKEELAIHLLTHTGERRNECSVCSRRFTRKAHLTNHMRSHTGKRMFSCSVNGKRSKKRNLNVQRSFHSGETPFACSMCNMNFTQKTSLRVHLRSHQEAKLNVCSVCAKKFNDKENLAIHMQSHIERRIKCSQCPKRFNQKNLKLHMRLHSEERPFPCSICGKRFPQAVNLRVHMRSHTGEKPYECSFCGQKFSQTGHRNVHMRLHTGEKPYECSLCGRKFSQKGHFNIHMRLHNAVNR